jgi:uncharacterized OsmC-like protein
MITPADQLNGVDLVAVGAITERYRKAPDTGRTRFDATVNWLGGYRTEARLGAFPRVPGDEPTALAGSATGPAPEEMLLGAVAQCLIVGLAGSASARGIRIRSLTVDAEGIVNLTAAYGVEAGNPGFREIRLTVHLEADADRDDLQGLIDRALARAPIPNTVARPVPVTAQLA